MTRYLILRFVVGLSVVLLGIQSLGRGAVVIDSGRTLGPSHSVPVPTTDPNSPSGRLALMINELPRINGLLMRSSASSRLNCTRLAIYVGGIFRISELAATMKEQTRLSDPEIKRLELVLSQMASYSDYHGNNICTTIDKDKDGMMKHMNDVFFKSRDQLVSALVGSGQPAKGSNGARR